MSGFDAAKNKLHYATNRNDCIDAIVRMVDEGTTNYTDNQWRSMVTDVVKTHFDADPIVFLAAILQDGGKMVRKASKNRMIGFMRATAKIFAEELYRPEAVQMGPRKVMSPKERADQIKAVQDELCDLCNEQSTDMSRNLDRRHELVSKLAGLLGRGGVTKAQKWFEDKFPHLVGD